MVIWISVIVEERKEVVLFKMCFDKIDVFEKGIEDDLLVFEFIIIF